MDGATVLDDAVLTELADDVGADLLPELIETFLEETRERLVVMATMWGEGNIAGLGHEAHTLKSTSGSFGALALQAAAARLEAACEANDAIAGDVAGAYADAVEVRGPEAVSAFAARLRG